MASIDSSGILIHARHAYMPNKLGYCGPDDRGKILQCLQESDVDEKLISTLKNFEAAYPFVKLIGKSTGRQPFDYKVAEAYWIGNELLNQVSPDQFYKFALNDLGKRNRTEIRNLFQSLQNRALPHHTFYVLNTAMSVLSDHHHSTDSDPEVLARAIDNCRISWGRVVEVQKERLVVKYRPLGIKNGRIKFRPYALKKVEYDHQLPPFDRIVPGTPVSIHWNFACDVLSETQLRNIQSYTKGDVNSTNLYLDAMRKP
ncbi:MAG TPA: DUF6390 family protein [Nitrososphaerales archaeon]|nr:DUF6390 family protein [Nitrososphaerales archaeon]